VFQKFYSRALARRLVSENSESEDAESSMIAHLKVCVACVDDRHSFGNFVANCLPVSVVY
jgi:hypothetical protein